VIDAGSYKPVLAMPFRAIGSLSPLVRMVQIIPTYKCESVSMNSLVFAMFGMPGPMEMLIILAIFLLLFGGRQLPSLMRNLGASAREFKKGVQGMDEEAGRSDAFAEDDKSD
jgi:sec-independent protein translocase protein TatA